MPQQRLSNDEFLAQLTTLLSGANAKGHGSVFLSQKSLPTSADSMTDGQSQILIRATNGATGSKPKPGVKVEKRKPEKKLKLATIVEVSDLDAFYAKYADVCKKGMEGLRKRDKKKAKEKAKAKKKGKGSANTA